MDKVFYIGVDVGGTKISTAISGRDGKILENVVVPTGSEEGSDKVMERILKTIGDVMELSGTEPSEIAAVGIGAPGPQDQTTGSIVTTTNLPFKNYSLTKPLEEKFGIPAYLDNDANAAAIAEWMFGEGRGCRNVIYITVSTGVGAGAVLNGKPYSGTTGNALEIGHMTIDPDSPHRCNCGNYGDLESLSSGTAIAKRGKEAVERGEDTILRNCGEISSYEVYEAYLKGDRVSEEILTEAFEYLGIALANMILIFDPEVIAIGGGVSSMGGILFDTATASMRKRCFGFMADRVKIVPTGLSKDTGVLGALALAIVKSEQ